jgi:uncharacterized LabA/DUF88 family protein
VYIDGCNLYYGRLRGSRHKWLDVVTLFDQLVRVQDPSSVVHKVHFFSAPALGKFASHGETSVAAQESYHRALENRHPERFMKTLGAHAYDRHGTALPLFVPGAPYDRVLTARVWRLVEKKTDVNLALAMYRDAVAGRFRQLVLCSNDSDAEPALAAIRVDCPSVVIGVVTPVRPPDAGDRRRVSASLARHAHWTRHHILDAERDVAQLPDCVPTRKKPVLRPAYW